MNMTRISAHALKVGAQNKLFNKFAQYAARATGKKNILRG